MNKNELLINTINNLIIRAAFNFAIKNLIDITNIIQKITIEDLRS